MAALADLLVQGVLGTYTHFEATVVFGLHGGKAINVFTLLVAEDREGQAPQAPSYLGGRIKIQSLQDWMFGVQRYALPISDLVPAIAVMTATEKWQGSGEALSVGKVHPLAPQFVAPDSTTTVPWNRVLKNNYWSGSHVFEWANRDKLALQPLFEDTARLQELSEAVNKVVPMVLAGLSDRLGNLAVQLPAMAVMTEFTRLRPNGLLVDVAWHPKIPPRELRAICSLVFDDTVTGYTSAPVLAGTTTLPLPGGAGMHEGYLWDEANQIVLAGTGSTGIINAVTFGMALVDQEPRTFSVPQDDGSSKPYRIGLVNSGPSSVVGNPDDDDNGGYTLRRIYKDQADRLRAGRVFVPYKPQPGQAEAEHQKALSDLRVLINTHGKTGVWLWDPYLSAGDLLETLFHCHHSGSNLRALADKESIGPLEPQRAILNGIHGNSRGLRLEYRIRHGSRGFKFHDRFLIFPRDRGGALAWSLGTSVNSIGEKHHILQQVDNGELIKNDFVELWDQLDAPEFLVWKKP